VLIIHLPQSVPKVKTAQEIEGIRRACTMAASVLQAACRLVKVPATSLSASVCQVLTHALHDALAARCHDR